MTETFDTYSKHSFAYKMTQVSALIFMLLLLPILILENRLNNLLSNFWNSILLCVFVLSVLCFLAGLFIRTVRSNILMYVKDGELNLDTDKFQLDSRTYNFDDLTRLEFKVIGYRGQPGSRAGKDGTGNKIKICEKSNQVFEKAFAINTKEQFDNLKSILLQWKQTGLKVKVDGFDLR